MADPKKCNPDDAAATCAGGMALQVNGVALHEVILAAVANFGEAVYHLRKVHGADWEDKCTLVLKIKMDKWGKK